MDRDIAVVPWHQSLPADVPPARRRISGWWSLLKFHCQNETRAQFRLFNSTIIGYARSAHIKSLQCVCVCAAGQFGSPGTPGTKPGSLRSQGGVSSQVSQSDCPDPEHPIPPFKLHGAITTAACASKQLRLTSPSRPHHTIRTSPPAAGHTGHTSQGSRQFFINTPHSLSEPVPAALSSISNQAGPGTKAQ